MSCQFIPGQIIAESEQGEATLRRQLEELRILHAIATAGAEATNVDSLIERAVQIIGNTFYPDNFGILLLDESGGFLRPHPSYRLREERHSSITVALGQGISGQVAMDGRPRLIGDISCEPNYLQIDPLTQSELCVPLKVGERVMGVINAESLLSDAFTEADERLLTTLAGQLATAIDRLRAQAAEQQRARQLAIINELAREMTALVAVKDLCITVTQRLALAFGYFNVGILTVGQGRHDLLLQAVWRPYSIVQAGQYRQAFGCGIVGRAAQSGQVALVNDTRQDPDFFEVEKDRVLSELAIPLKVGTQVIGVLNVKSERLNAFDASEVAMLTTVADQFAVTLERVRLFEATRQQAELMARLASLGEALNRPLTVSEVIENIGEGAMTLAHADRVAIYLRQEDDTVQTVWARGLSTDYLAQVTTHVQDVPGGKLLHSTLAVLIDDVQALPESSFLRQVGQREGYRTVGLWPLVYQDRVIAAFGCYYDTPHQWSNAEREVLSAFGRQSAVALQNAFLFGEAHRRAAYLEALNTINSVIATAPDLPQLLEIALDQTLRALGLQRGCIWVGEQHTLREFPPEVGLCGVNLLHSNLGDRLDIVVVNDWQQLPEGHALIHCLADMERFGVRASLTVPILVEGRSIGGLTVASSTPRQWLPEEIALVEGVGRQMGSAVERIELLVRIQDHARQIQQIMDTVPEGVILLDEEGQIILANPAAQKVLSLLGAAKAGERLVQLADQPLESLLAATNGRTWHEILFQGPPRQVFETAAQPLAGTERAGGWVLVLRDVTQDRENQTRIQMQERLATVGQLAAGIAHDFNNIMAAIVVYADLLKRDPNLPSASRERLIIIQQQVQRAASLIRQILDFSRRSVMEQSTLDLLPFVKELDKLLVRVLPETIRLELTYQPGSYLVNADPTRLQQVFMNLAVNARDAMPEGGILHFGLERLHLGAADHTPFADLPPGDWIRITVRDSGSGIADEVMPHIFEPFFTTKPVGQGTGLGLAQVYGIIRQHDGYIDARSKLGQGATFQIYLPALEAPREETFTPLEAVESAGAGETILVVEDDAAAREAMKVLLEANNYRVLTAANGFEALQIFELQRTTIALVVSDIVMPHMGGVKLYHALREIWPHVKVLFITGHPLQEENQALLESGNVNWLQKPFAVPAFYQMTRQLVGAK